MAAVTVVVARAKVAGYGEGVYRDEGKAVGRGVSNMARAAHQNYDRFHCQEALSDREEPRVYECLCVHAARVMNQSP